MKISGNKRVSCDKICTIKSLDVLNVITTFIFLLKIKNLNLDLLDIFFSLSSRAATYPGKGKRGNLLNFLINPILADF